MASKGKLSAEVSNIFRWFFRVLLSNMFDGGSMTTQTRKGPMFGSSISPSNAIFSFHWSFDRSDDQRWFCRALYETLGPCAVFIQERHVVRVHHAHRWISVVNCHVIGIFLSMNFYVLLRSNKRPLPCKCLGLWPGWFGNLFGYILMSKQCSEVYDCYRSSV